MSRLVSMSIRAQILIVALIVVVPAAGIIIYSGIQLRENAISAAKSETQKLADSIAAENQNLVAAAQQLILALAQLPDVKKQNAARVQPVLRDILKLNPQYSNIFVIDRSGLVWATAVPQLLHQNVADRRYFRNALASSRLSSGEYAISRATAKPAFNIAYPLKTEQGVTVGVISVGFVLEAYKQMLERAKLPPETSFVLLDHKGTVLYRAINPAEYIGRQYDPALFKKMQEGPDAYTYSGITAISGDKRIVSYRKLSLPGESSPYLYIRTGIPIAAVLANANSVLFRNLAIFITFLALAVFFAWLIGKRSIADRVTMLGNASRSLAEGNLSVRVSELVTGGELGRLGKTFDSMAQTLESRAQALLDSERNYREIFNASKDAIIVYDAATGCVLEVNKAMEDMYGYTRDEIVRKTAGDLGSGEPSYTREDAKRWIEKTLHDGPQSFEWKARKKNGTLFWTEIGLSATNIRGAGRLLAVIRDITERKHAEEEKQKLRDQLLQVQKMESIGQLAGGIAHDFNNILAAVIGYGSIVRRKLAEDDPVRPHVDQLLAAAQRAAGLTQSLLAFSRKQIINPVAVDLNESIHKVERFLSRIIGEDIILTTSLCSKTLTVLIDPTQIEQVMMNLATNARDAMPNGGTLVIETAQVQFDEAQTVTHSFGKPGAYAVLTVSDSGIGFDDRTKEKLFEPFFTTKEVGKGTGLGLSIVYGIVKQNNGHINVYSEPDKGTTFKIYFPLVEGEAGAQHAGPAITARGGTETILLAEDNDIVRSLTESVLSEAGYRVIEATDGEEALAKFRQSGDSVHLVIVDVIMPKKNGKAVYEEVRRTRPDIKVLFTSGYPADLVQKEGVLERGLNFLPKPVSPEEILRKVRDVLDQ